MSGWHDLLLPATLAAWRAACADGPDHHLVIGPWTHTDLGGTLHGRRFRGGGARELGLSTLQLDFFDRHLRGGESRRAAALVYVTGADRWRALSAWPPPTRLTALSLQPPVQRMLLPTEALDGLARAGAGPAELSARLAPPQVVLRSEPLASWSSRARCGWS